MTFSVTLTYKMIRYVVTSTTIWQYATFSSSRHNHRPSLEPRTQANYDDVFSFGSVSNDERKKWPQSGQMKMSLFYQKWHVQYWYDVNLLCECATITCHQCMVDQILTTAMQEPNWITREIWVSISGERKSFLKKNSSKTLTKVFAVEQLVILCLMKVVLAFQGCCKQEIFKFGCIDIYVTFMAIKYLHYDQSIKK